MNNFILCGNTVEWNNMNICCKKNVHDNPINKCDFDLDNSIPECIYKGPNTAVHLCLVKVEDILESIKTVTNKSKIINDSSVVMKTCVILIFTKNISIAELDKMDNKLQSLRQIEKNDKLLNKWKKDNNYIENSSKKIVNLPRYKTPGYISKHGNYRLPISYREIEILSHPVVKVELENNIDAKLLMILEHRKENSKPYGSWDYSTIGGGFIYGETPGECIIRETYEESGLLLENYNLNPIVKLELPSNYELGIENSNTIHVFKTYLE